MFASRVPDQSSWPLDGRRFINCFGQPIAVQRFGDSETTIFQGNAPVCWLSA
jgi:hypothetical protein